MTTANLLAELHSLAPNAHLYTSNESADFEVDGLRPLAVLRPSTVEDIAALLRFASARGLAVTARGGGTALGEGNRPARLDLVLDMTGQDRIIEHRPRDLTVTVEAGVTVAALQTALAEHGQMLALDPPFPERATVGGVLAANSFGPRRQRYGTARDLLIGSRAALADGTAVRFGGKVVKNVAGYDLNKLLIGSHGTIAVITEATLKVTPLPPSFGLLIAAFPSLDAAHAVALAVTQSRLQPLTLDLLSPVVARQLAGECGMTPGERAWLLAAEVGGPPSLVERTLHELAATATEGGAESRTVLEHDERLSFMRRLREYGRSAADPSTLLLSAGVLPSETAAATNALARAVEREMIAAYVIRGGSGIVYAALEVVSGSDAPALVARARAALAGFGATVVVERAPAETKAGLDAWGLSGADVELMRRVKAAYDPEEVLSPGRLV